MNDPSDREKEDRALEALIVLALRRDRTVEVAPPDFEGAKPFLSPEDQEALDALGPDWIASIVAGTWRSSSRKRRLRRKRRHLRQELTGALHRSDQDTDLPEEVRQEMERRIQELEAAEDEDLPP